MSRYLVRWKFGPNSLLNHTANDTWWYQQFHESKKAALDHYVSLLYNSSPAMAMTTEIFQLVQLEPGKPEPEDVTRETVENQIRQEQEQILTALDKRNAKIMKDFNKGLSRKEIAEKMSMNYQTVCNIIRQGAT